MKSRHIASVGPRGSVGGVGKLTLDVSAILQAWWGFHLPQQLPFSPLHLISEEHIRLNYPQGCFLCLGLKFKHKTDFYYPGVCCLSKKEPAFFVFVTEEILLNSWCLSSLSYI